MRALCQRYADDARAALIHDALHADRELTMAALAGALPALLLAVVAQRAATARVVVCADAQGFADDLESLGCRCAVLPELERFDDDEADGGDRTGHAKRAAALEAFATGAWLIATPAAADQRVPDLAILARESLVLTPGQRHQPHALVERLVESGYRLAASVEARGQVAMRGGIVDVFPWIGSDALRLDFFGDELDSIRRFDALTQESIAPINEAVLAKGTLGLATKPLWPQLPAGPIVVLGDAPLRARLGHDHGRREVRLARNKQDSSDLDGAAAGIDRLRGDLANGLRALAALDDEGVREVHILARNEEAVRELAGHLRDAGLDAINARVGRLSAGWRDAELGVVVVHDFELAARSASRRRGGRIGGGAPLASLDELNVGDHVVHLRHGIALFRGVSTLEKRGFLEDYLLLEFAAESRLYVPVESLGEVQRYVGGSGRAPELSALGSGAWAKRRAKVRKAIDDMSAQLLATQAQRVAAGGWPCPDDTPAVRRFEAAFPHEETEDQLAATREIKADLQRPLAMDRLLCGDVGFGKTEVAMRACFKVADAGKQVAVLAPTTLLAEQHVETFRARMLPHGLRVAGIDRFRSAKERAALSAELANGTVHIVVGTHALLSDKLVFRDLGLVVIDEEHRFGVKQKEKLKALAPSVHVLALSATPIPRTLHFSLMGLRDISTLAEAPAERLAVESRVAPWDDQTIRHALERERERGGQVFVVHHRIADLDPLAYRLGKLVPGLRIDTLHGQMDEERIARVMEGFRAGALDVLIATSIVESGIDIPNANTLIVADATHFGLAELHQIRGRIGRFTRQAYAYFLTPPKREIGEAARERLAAIQDYAELGAGFKLAMRDLELRGAGNLLGAEQSGQIDAVGYELYTSMVAEAVAKAKTSAGTMSADAAAAPAIAGDLSGLSVDAYIPDDWLETPSLRLDVHQRIERARRISDLQAVAATVRDRFGALPEPVRRLFAVRALRLRMPHLGIARIEASERQVRLFLHGAPPKELNANAPSEVVHIQLTVSAGKPVATLFLRAGVPPEQVLHIMTGLLGCTFPL